ncbi:hypothetical protein [Streptomyces sp. NPDC018833]|uniref:hypothetical protein n=1 Tax=Streptomyces sp. NPDC018833 TaxID=3365053 RepID=UPI0037B45177
MESAYGERDDEQRDVGTVCGLRKTLQLGSGDLASAELQPECCLMVLRLDAGPPTPATATLVA